MDDFQQNELWMAKRLGISPVQCDVAIQRLIDANILSQSKALQPRHLARFVRDTPSRYIQKHHKQMLQKAILSLEKDHPDTRSVSGCITFVDLNRIENANKMIAEFQKTLVEYLTSGNKKDAVYNLNVNLIRLDKN